MCRFLAIWGFALLVATSGFATTSTVQADSRNDVTISFFYGSLDPHGRWFAHPRYGYVWRPEAVPYGWRPYTNGRWVWTVEYGWVWESDYEWGWATFHYGRWAHDPDYGWYWVPGTVWAPAWVAWRTGYGFIGWYPLPPGSYWSFSTGLVYGGINVYASYYTPYWVFVPERHFLNRRLHNVVVRPHQNSRFIRHTRRATRYARNGDRIVNRSVSVRRIEKATNRRVVRRRVRIVDEWRQRRRTGPGAPRVRLYQPRIAPDRSATRPRRVIPPPFQRPRGVEPAPRRPRTRVEPPRRVQPQPRGVQPRRDWQAPPRQGRTRVAPPRRVQPQPRGIPAQPRPYRRATPSRRVQPQPQGVQPRRDWQAPPGQGRTRVAPPRRAQPPPRGVPARQPRTRVAPRRRAQPPPDDRQPPPGVGQPPGQRRVPEGPPGWRDRRGR